MCSVWTSSHLWREQAATVDVPILVFSGRFQSNSTALCREHRAIKQYWIFISSWETCTTSLLEVMLYGHGSALTAPPHTKRQILVRLSSCHSPLPVSYLLHTLETVLVDVVNLPVTACVDASSWKSWTTCLTRQILSHTISSDKDTSKKQNWEKSMRGEKK